MLKKIIIPLITLIILGLFHLKDTNINTYQEEIYINKNIIPVFALNKNGYVAKANITNTNTELIPYIISALTINSENSVFLPDDFWGVIPQNTKLLSYQKNNDILELNFSNDLLNTTKNNENKIIESLIYSLCNLKDINKIKIFIEGKPLNELPISHQKMPDILDKSYGINKTYDITNITDIKTVTVYYLGKNNEDYYFVPITKIVNSKLEPIEIVVNELKRAPLYDSNLISFLTASYEIKSYEINEGGLHLSFDKSMLANISDEDISEKVKYALIMSLKDTYNIDKVDISSD